MELCCFFLFFASEHVFCFIKSKKESVILCTPWGKTVLLYSFLIKNLLLLDLLDHFCLLFRLPLCKYFFPVKNPLCFEHIPFFVSWFLRNKLAMLLLKLLSISRERLDGVIRKILKKAFHTFYKCVGMCTYNNSLLHVCEWIPYRLGLKVLNGFSLTPYP